MSKNVGMARSMVLAALVAAALPAQPEPTVELPVVVVPFVERPIAIDGDLREWDRAAVIRIDRAEQVFQHAKAGSWGGADDLSATFYLSYDAAHLYLSGRIQDNSLVREASRWHEADAIELFLDLDLSDATAHLFNDDDVQLFLMPLSRQRPWGLTDYRNRDEARPRGSAMTGIRIACRERDDGYDFEAVVAFHNFAALREGVTEIGLNIAIDDHDQGLDRYQYATWNGRNPVDDTRNMGRLVFAGSPPLVDADGDGGGLSQRVLDSLPFVLLPALTMVVLWLVLRGWSVASRQRPVMKPIGRVLGVVLFVLGLVLPAWLIELRDKGYRARIDTIATELRGELAAMERGNMASYPGGKIDGPLIDLLAGRTVDRVQSFTYSSLARLAPRGFGAGPKSYPNEGFAVLPYWVPLPLRQPQRLVFPEPLRGGYLNVVLSMPPEINNELPPQVRLVLGRANETTIESVLDLDGFVEPGSFVNRPELGITFKQVELTGEVDWVGLTAVSGEGLRLVGLTLLPDLLRPPQPLHLGLPSRTGVETDLRGPHPEDVGIHLVPDQRHRVELDAARTAGFEKLWLFYKADYPPTGDVAVGRDAKVCEVELQFADEQRPPMVVELRHQTSMFFGVARFNVAATPPDPAASIAFSWEDADQERYLTLGYAVDLPEGQSVRSIEFRNVGSYPVRFRSAVFGAPKANLLAEPAESPLEYPGTARKLRMKVDRRERFDGVDFSVYRNAALEASTLVGAERAARATLPRGVQRQASEIQARAIADGDRRTYEAYVALPGSWSGGVLGVILDDPDSGAYGRWLHMIGIVLCLFAAPVLLLLFSELLSVFKSLRLRLIAVFSAATLVPLAILSLVLVRVIEDGHEADLRTDLQQAMSAATGRLRAEQLRLVGAAETWLQTLASTVASRSTAELRADEARAVLEAQLRATMVSQLPPAWEGGYLRFEFVPREGSGLAPFSLFEGDPLLAVVDVPLRRDPDVYLSWGRPFFGVRRESPLGDLGVCALSVGRPPDVGLLGGLAPGRGVLLADGKGYPLASVAGGEVTAAQLATARPTTMAQLRQSLVDVVESGQPGVRRLSIGDQQCVGVWDALRDQQETPRLLLGLVDRERPATLPLGIGRVPVGGFFLAGGGLLLLLSVFLSFVVTARISKPIEQLEAGAVALGRGDLEVALRADEGGQIGRLTHAFNEMAQQLRGRIQDLSDLNRGIQELTAKLDLEETLATAVGFFARHSPADRVRILLQERGQIRVAGHTELLDARAADVAALLEASGAASLLWPPSRAQDRGALSDLLHGFGAVLALPLVQGGRTLGAVLLLFESRRPREVNLELLASMASYTAAAITNARLYRHAVEDPDTGAYVGDYLRRLATEAVAAASERGAPLALLGVWIDGGGSLAGSLGARRFAQMMERWAHALRAVLPAGAVLAREEAGFRVLLPGADRAAARALLEALPAPSDAAGAAADIGRACALYPEQAASAEFLFDAIARAEHGQPREEVTPGQLRQEGLVLHSPSMQELLRRIERVAPTDLTVLFEGETGTGKEVLTDLLHRWSKRAAGPLVKVNCAALAEALLESELFGHERGAFTGALARKIGRFELAHGGTLFLDEIGEISLDLQVKLLRVLQEREIERVGGVESVSVDVRVVAATNRNLREMVERGAFREDLYYRLQGMVLHVPPLRERKEEIPDLVEAFRTQAQAAGQTHAEGFTPDALDELFRRDWPGNLRELRNAVLRALVLARGRLVTREDVLGVAVGRAQAPAAEAQEQGSAAPPAGEPVEDRRDLLRALLREQGSVSTQEYVARAGISARTGLRDLAELVDLGIVRRVGRRRGARYQLATGAAKEREVVAESTPRTGE
jgi:DNA-binding NtrC family response regulator/HAMP domain-containing protein